MSKKEIVWTYQHRWDGLGPVMIVWTEPDTYPTGHQRRYRKGRIVGYPVGTRGQAHGPVGTETMFTILDSNTNPHNDGLCEYEGHQTSCMGNATWESVNDETGEIRKVCVGHYGIGPRGWSAVRTPGLATRVDIEAELAARDGN